MRLRKRCVFSSDDACIELRFSLDEHWMGEEVRYPRGEREFSVQVRSDEPVSELRLGSERRHVRVRASSRTRRGVHRQIGRGAQELRRSGRHHFEGIAVELEWHRSACCSTDLEQPGRQATQVCAMTRRPDMFAPVVPHSSVLP
jgi:hypothetical protein